MFVTLLQEGHGVSPVAKDVLGNYLLCRIVDLHTALGGLLLYLLAGRGTICCCLRQCSLVCCSLRRPSRLGSLQLLLQLLPLLRGSPVIQASFPACHRYIATIK